MSRKGTELPPLGADDTIPNGRKAEAGFLRNNAEVTESDGKEASPSSSVTQDPSPHIAQDSPNVIHDTAGTTQDSPQTIEDSHIKQDSHTTQDSPQTFHYPSQTSQDLHTTQDHLQAVQDSHKCQDHPQTIQDFPHRSQEPQRVTGDPLQTVQDPQHITQDSPQTTHDPSQTIQDSHKSQDSPQTIQDPHTPQDHPQTIQGPHISQDYLHTSHDPQHATPNSPQTTQDLPIIQNPRLITQDPPHTTQDPPHTAQYHPHTAQDLPQTTTDPTHITQDYEHLDQDLPHITQDHPHISQDHPQTSHYHPQTSQDHPHTSQDYPHSSQDHPHSSQDHTHTTLNHPHTSRDHPHVTQDHPHTSCDHPHTSQDHSHTSHDHPHTSRDHPHIAADPAHRTQEEEIKKSQQAMQDPHMIRDPPLTSQDLPHTDQDLPHTKQDLPHPNQDLPHTSPHPASTTHVTPVPTHVTQEEEVKTAPEPVKSTAPVSTENMTKAKHKEGPTQPGEKVENAPMISTSANHGTETPFVDPARERVVAPTAEAESISDFFDVDIDDDGNPADLVSVGRKPRVSDQQNGASREQEPGPPIMEELEVPVRDEPDSFSLYSYYMESDFRYYFQHPYVRLFIAYFVTFCNFLIYAEDPVAHSRTECNIPVIGNSFAFLFTRYPPNAWSLLKVVLWLVGLVVGLIVGKLFFHTFLFNKIFRLKMFSDDKGSWMTIFLCTILSIFIFSYVYNLFLLIGGDSTSDYHISPYMTIANHIFMKAAATGTWCGDFFTAWMVTDMMLQEKLYPMWAMRLRRWWNTGYHRIILFWIIVCTSSFIVIFVIATDYINWDSLNRDFLHTNELSRAFLASFILVMDIIIVMQDWDFPHFVGAIDIKLPGINTAHIRFKIPRLLKKLEYWHVHISGKWFNYGILFVVILLDLNMWKNQIFYAPFDYGQYIDSENRIHSVNDEFSVNSANETIISFAYRNSTIDPITGKRYIELDNIMNARYNGYALGVKAIAFVPSISVFIMFGVLVWMYGRMPKPTKDDPYGGRLKKRKKRRFSMRVGWKRLRKRFRSTPSVLAAIKAFKDGARREREIVSEEEKGLGVAEKVVDRWKSTAHGESEDGAGPSHQDGHREDGKQELNMNVTEV